MTPEQEALADALERCRRLVAGAARDHRDFAPLFPLDEDFDADEPSGPERHLIRSFAKNFEQFQDQFSRALLRAALVVGGRAAGSGRKLDTIFVEAAALVGLDLMQLRDFAAIRNSLVHDYAMAFHDVAPILNRAWERMPDLIAVVASVESFIATRDLLKDAP